MAKVDDNTYFAEAHAFKKQLGSGEQDSKPFYDAIATVAKSPPGMGSFAPWLGSLPKNMTVGTYKAALNLIETGADVVDSVSSGTDSAVRKVAGTPDDGSVPRPVPVREQFPEFFKGAHEFADAMASDNTLSDDIAQGVAQFAVPFSALLKVFGGLQAGATALNVARSAAAEAGTAAGAFEAHEGRLADLAQLGREAEGRFGDLLRRVAPDDSLIGAYINYMTDRENEGQWEGRFKNAVDSLVGTGALAGVLKGAITGFKAVMQPEALKVGPAAQRGSVGVAASRADELTDIERARALKNTEVVEGGEHIVLEGDTVNQNADVVPLRSPTREQK